MTQRRRTGIGVQGPPWKTRDDNDKELDNTGIKTQQGKAEKVWKEARFSADRDVLTWSGFKSSEVAPGYGFFSEGADQSDNLANRHFQFLQFYHVPSGRAVAFKAFITQWEDAYNSEWHTENVYGRMDPIATFKRTGRIIQAGFTIPAGSVQEAATNLARISELVRYLYPQYDGGTIKGAPFLKFQFMNWAQNSGKGPSLDPKNSGLLGFVNGFQFAPNLEAGVHQSGLEIFPKEMKVSFSYTVIHEGTPGFRGDNFAMKDYPYGVGQKQTLGMTENTMSDHQSDLHKKVMKANASTILNG